MTTLELRANVARADVAKTDLAEREARHRATLDALHEGVVVQGAEGQILSANPAAERVLGMSADQLHGLTSLDPRWRAVREDGTPFPVEERPAMVALRTGCPQANVIMGIHQQDGSLVWLVVTAQPLLPPGAAPRRRHLVL